MGFIYLKHRRKSFQFINKYSMIFDGVNEFINTVDINALDGIAAMTVSAWIKQPTVAIQKEILSKWDPHAVQSSWAFQTDNSASDELQVFIADSLTDAGANNGITTNADLVGGVWYNVAFVFNGNGTGNSGRLKIYVNEIEKTITYNGTIPAALTSSSSTVKIGKLEDSIPRYFNGNIDEVGIFTTNLTTSQMSEIYNNGKPKNLLNHSARSNLVAYWRLGDGDTFDGTNWTIKDNKGTNNGTSSQMEQSDREANVP